MLQFLSVGHNACHIYLTLSQHEQNSNLYGIVEMHLVSLVLYVCGTGCFLHIEQFKKYYVLLVYLFEEQVRCNAPDF